MTYNIRTFIYYYSARVAHTTMHKVNSTESQSTIVRYTLNVEIFEK